MHMFVHACCSLLSPFAVCVPVLAVCVRAGVSAALPFIFLLPRCAAGVRTTLRMHHLLSIVLWQMPALSVSVSAAPVSLGVLKVQCVQDIFPARDLAVCCLLSPAAPPCSSISSDACCLALPTLLLSSVLCSKPRMAMMKLTPCSVPGHKSC
jgi:hypothetical protein